MRWMPVWALARAISYLVLGLVTAAVSSARAAEIVGIVVCVAMLIGWEVWRLRSRRST